MSEDRRAVAGSPSTPRRSESGVGSRRRATRPPRRRRRDPSHSRRRGRAPADAGTPARCLGPHTSGDAPRRRAGAALDADADHHDPTEPPPPVEAEPADEGAAGAGELHEDSWTPYPADARRRAGARSRRAKKRSSVRSSPSTTTSPERRRRPRVEVDSARTDARTRVPPPRSCRRSSRRRGGEFDDDAPPPASRGARARKPPDRAPRAEDVVTPRAAAGSPRGRASCRRCARACASQPPRPAAVAAKRPAPAPRPPRPPLVIVPPHVGTVAPAPQPEGSARGARAALWWEELFNDDYLRTMEKITDAQIVARGRLHRGRAWASSGAGRCSTSPAAPAATRSSSRAAATRSSGSICRWRCSRAPAKRRRTATTKLNFVQGDMREMTFDEQFDGVYCWNTSFGFFEEEKNAQVIDRVHRSLKAGGQFLLDVVNRDFLIRQSPSLAWFEGDGCVCMDEMTVDFITSRMKVKRTMMLDDGRSREIEYSMRVYSLHELGRDPPRARLQGPRGERPRRRPRASSSATSRRARSSWPRSADALAATPSMALRKIATIGHPVLRQRARELTREELASAPTQRLIDDIVETMRDANGAGIAANQVHEPVRVCVVEVEGQPALPVQAELAADRPRQPRRRRRRPTRRS